MKKHLERDLARLGDQLSDLGTLVVEACDKATVMIQTFDLVLAEEIVQGEAKINEMEVDIEEECLKMLALHQPVAVDLRFLIVVLKVNNDLERMGDQTVNIVERVKFLVGQERVVADLDFVKMGEVTSSMVHRALRALIDRDVSLARQVLDMDDDLDALHAKTYRVLQSLMAEQPGMVPAATSWLTISSNLERIGDLATNIAEDLIFMEEGEVIRHLES